MWIIWDIRLLSMIPYGFVGMITPLLLLHRPLSVKLIALAAVLNLLLAAMSVGGIVQTRRTGAFLKFRPWMWYVFPHLSYVVGWVVGGLVFWSLAPIE